MLFLIRFYQVVLSPHFVPTCRYLPTCSQYAYEAIALWGPWKGSYLALRRLMSCHPLSSPRVDNVPMPASYKPTSEENGID